MAEKKGPWVPGQPGLHSWASVSENLKKGERADKMAQHRSSSSLLHLGAEAAGKLKASLATKVCFRPVSATYLRTWVKTKIKKQDDLIRNLLRPKKWTSESQCRLVPILIDRSPCQAPWLWHHPVTASHKAGKWRDVSVIRALVLAEDAS